VGQLGSAPGSVQADDESEKRTPFDHKNSQLPARSEQTSQLSQSIPNPSSLKPLAQQLPGDDDIAHQAKRKYKNNDPRLIYTSAKQEQHAMKQ